MFAAIPDKPNHPALEEEILARWEAERTFERLRGQNRGGPRWSFIDGPITANNPMGVHHAWGRTLKDVFQRYKAMRGFDERYQNGFDSQGLWVEVEVERALGLGSKREIEDYGLAEFAERCKERVAKYGAFITEQSRRLGMWMDWDNTYYTFSDTNIEYIWRFLKECHARGWLYEGHRATQWCPRCGTSLSQHEQAGEDKYVELAHPSLYVRFPLRGRPGEALAVWTTTPWTLPANVAAAVKPDAEYVLVDGAWWLRDLKPDAAAERVVRGEELVGLEYEGPFDHLPAQAEVVHRVIPWDDVEMNEGTGIVHIAPGAGAEDFELSRVHDLPVLVPIDESGRLTAAYDEFASLTTDEVAAPVTQSLQERGLLIEYGAITHRYPICWRCSTPLVFRVVDDWFISCNDIRQPLLDANAQVEWTPAFYSKRMDDWLRNMGDWNISRKRYFGLPLPFYPCECGMLNVIGSRAELEVRATRGLDQLQELHRPWIDEVTIACETCGKGVHRITEVGDAWLDAGIVPFSTLGWNNPQWVEHGYATGASSELSGADLPDHAYWEQWFPANWISEMREQIRLWFYSISFMAMTLVGRLPYERVLTYEKARDEKGREMHKSWGNAIEAQEALDNMGADPIRWLFCEQVPSQNLNFGYGPANEVKRRLLTYWNCVKFFVDYANVSDFTPGDDGELQILDRWLIARTDQLVAELTAAYERFWTPDVVRAFDAFVDDLSNWYIRRSRRRFWNADSAALQTLWQALVRSAQGIAPVMPFLADYVWGVLRTDDAPDSVFLAGWPEEGTRDGRLLAEVAEVRRIVELGRQARAEAGMKLRQPLRRLSVAGAFHARSHEDELKEELRVKEVEFDTGPVARFTYKPNLPVLGPKLGKDLREVRDALARHDFEILPGGSVRVAGHDLSPTDELIPERAATPGWAYSETLSVGFDLELDDELVLEGRVLDLIHLVNTMRKEAGLELADRITLTLPQSERDLLAHEEWIKDEVLAVEIRTDSVAGPQIAKTEQGSDSSGV
jgi:isoleucyl-tRNA synthetase